MHHPCRCNQLSNELHQPLTGTWLVICSYSLTMFARRLKTDLFKQWQTPTDTALWRLCPSRAVYKSLLTYLLSEPTAVNCSAHPPRVSNGVRINALWTSAPRTDSAPDRCTPRTDAPSTNALPDKRPPAGRLVRICTLTVCFFKHHGCQCCFHDAAEN